MLTKGRTLHTRVIWTTRLQLLQQVRPVQRRMWKVLGNPSLDDSSTAPRQPQRRSAIVTGSTSSAQQHTSRLSSSVNEPNVALASSIALSSNVDGRKRPAQTPGSMTPAATTICGKYRITGTIRKGATGYLYSAVAAAGGGVDEASCDRANNGVGDDVVLKVEDCAAPKRQMQNEWQVYRALEEQRIATEGTSDPLPAPNTGGFPKAEFFTSTMPRLPPDLGQSSPFEDGGVGSGEGSAIDGSGVGRAVNVLAMERLGENLMTLSQGCRGGRFSLQTTLRLGTQMVSLLRILHSTGYVHRDIKPENFCMGRGKRGDRVFLIDYGLACLAGDVEVAATVDAERHKSSSTSTVWVEVNDASGHPQPTMAESSPASTPAPHEASVRAMQRSADVAGGEETDGIADGPSNGSGSISGEALPKPKPGTRLARGATGLVGSVRYLSLAAHAGGRQTRQCDLESLAHVLVYLVRGKLPWQGLTAKTREAHMEKIRASKAEETVETLCRGLPALAEYLSYIRSLRPGEAADYSHAERIFTDGLRRRGFPPDAPFDWMQGNLYQHPAKAAALGTVPAVHGKIRGVSVTGAGSSTLLSSATAASAATTAKRPRVVVAESAMAAPAVVTAGGIENGSGNVAGVGSPRGGYQSSGEVVGLFDLYADVPPPDNTSSSSAANDGAGRRKNSHGTASDENAPASSETPPAHEGNSVASALESTPAVADTSEAESVGGIAAPATAAGKSSRNHPSISVAMSAERLGDKRGANSGAAVVDVSVALGKIRPHIRGGGAGSKKFPRACALLTDLLSAKLSPENEEIFFHVLSDAVSGFRSAGGDRGGCRSMPVGSGAANGSDSRGETLGLKVEDGVGVVGDAVRRLVAAAYTRSGLFNGWRRDAVEKWGKEMVKRDGR